MQTNTSQSGQTIIETMVAVFILVMGITAAVGLAVFAMNTSTNVLKQIVANGLAREGIEAVKNMRDTNWLKQTLSTDCYDYPSATLSARCYKTWLTNTGSGEYTLNTGVGTNQHRVDYDPSTGTWVLDKAGNGRLGLNFNNNVTANGFAGYFYISGNNGTVTSDLDPGTKAYFYRTVLVDVDNTPTPYNEQSFERVRVRSRVWWTDKKCPHVTSYSTNIPTSCRLELSTSFTNWKNY